MNLQVDDEADVPSAALVELIHQKRGHLSARQRLQGCPPLVGSLARAASRERRLGRGVRWLLASALVVSLVAGAAMLGFERHAARSLSYAIDDGRLQPGGVIEADPASRPKLRFSDGTEVVLAAGTKAVLRSVGGHGARLSLSDGAAQVDVMHLPGARWLFDAGPFLITVTGTAFTVAWRSADEQLDLRMDRGTVDVSGPLSDGPIALRSGQHLMVHVRQGETFIRDRDDGPVPAVNPAPADTSPLSAHETPRDVAPVKTASRARVDRGCGNRDWAGQLAAGDFEGVVGQAERAGFETCLAGASSADLAALADAARYGRHDDVARRALLAQRSRFARSARARDAGFLLGRLEETQENLSAALEWYVRYLAESPAGTYASEALGRRMNLVQRLEGDDRARSVAEEYLGRFPQGTYAARARVLARSP